MRDLDASLVLIGEDAGGLRSCWTARADAAAAYREAEVFLLTSRFEVAPLVLVEAMAAKISFVS